MDAPATREEGCGAARMDAPATREEGCADALLRGSSFRKNVPAGRLGVMAGHVGEEAARRRQAMINGEAFEGNYEEVVE
jgi:hypothetical protein